MESEFNIKLSSMRNFKLKWLLSRDGTGKSAQDKSLVKDEPLKQDVVDNQVQSRAAAAETASGRSIADADLPLES